MKIICQSCSAKYTIADEKVRGRTVKIRCKKCSSAIVVKGPEEAPPDQEEEEDDATRVYSGDGPMDSMAMSIPPQDAEWTVTFDDGEQRGGTLDELRAWYQAGTIHDETFVWRDGMDDWQSMSQTPELLDSLRSPSMAPRPVPSTAPAAGSPDAHLGGGLFGGGGQAALVEKQHEQDLFGAPEQPPPEEDVQSSAPSNPMSKPPIPKFTAERGENSVLFTIDTIKAMSTQPGAPPTPSGTPDDDKVDFSALASVAPPPLMDQSFEQSFAPVPSAPGAPMMGGALAAPTLPTEFEPEPEPEPEPMPYQASFEAPQKSNKGVIIGLAAAVGLLLVVSLAFGGYVLFAGDEEKPVAANTDGNDKATAEPVDKSDNADEYKDDEDKKDDDTKDEDKKDEDKKDDDAKDGKDDGKDPKAAATTKVGGPLPTGTATKKDPKAADKKDPKADAKKDDKKDDKKDEPAASTTTAKFSRSAAISALGSAAGAASGCKKPGGPTGRGRVSVTFAPSGRVTTAVVSGPPFSGTSVGGCVAATFRRARVPAFKCSPVTVHKSFTIN